MPTHIQCVAHEAFALVKDPYLLRRAVKRHSIFCGVAGTADGASVVPHLQPAHLLKALMVLPTFLSGPHACLEHDIDKPQTPTLPAVHRDSARLHGGLLVISPCSSRQAAHWFSAPHADNSSESLP